MEDATQNRISCRDHTHAPPQAEGHNTPVGDRRSPFDAYRHCRQHWQDDYAAQEGPQDHNGTSRDCTQEHAHGHQRSYESGQKEHR
jgi:hypothetical protein